MWKIKLLGFVFLLIGVSGCERKFPSKAQAMTECEKWASKGKVIRYQASVPPAILKALNEEGESLDRKAHQRSCRNGLVDDYSDEHNQIIGMENQSIADGTWANQNGMRGDIKKVKIFRY